jgi:sulfide:quinone oxidoreductase
MVSTSSIDPRRVVIVGGGTAAIEAVLALHDLADNHVRVTLIAPEPDFILRPLDVGWPFADGHPREVPLEPFMREHGGHFRRTATLSVDSELRTVRCATGPDEPYDALIIAVGASARPVFEHVLTFDGDVLALNGLLADLERSRSRSLAFVVPKGCTWPLPLYELALMAADEVRGMHMGEVQLHLVTPEAAPLDIFGPEASAAVKELLDAAPITLHSGVSADIHRGGHVGTGSGEGLDVERVVALPVLDGPRLKGLPSDAYGYIPVDEYGRVIGVDAVYAAGDATDHPIKQGDLACQQADAVAAHVAATAGAPVEAVAYAPVLRGRLLTGHSDHFLRREKIGMGDSDTNPLWWQPKTVSGRYMAPYLEAQGVVGPPLRDENRGAGVDVRLSRSAGWSAVQSVTSTR